MALASDVVVLGSGLAGCTAGLFSARRGWSTIVVAGDNLGGELLNVSTIEDFPGFAEGVSGYELCPTVQEQAQRAGAGFEMTVAESVERDGDGWVVTAATGPLAARAVIVCTGERFKVLGVPGEVELAGRGVSHCATCDGPMLRDKSAAVVGGGDSGLQEALELAQHASEVVVFERRNELTGQQAFRDRIAQQANVQVLLEAEVDEIGGDGRVASLWARHGTGGERRQHAVDGVFVYAGMEPAAPRLPEVARDGGGHLVTDVELRTSLPGLFAAGGVRAGFAGQAVIAAGDGAAAALGAHRYLLGVR